MKVEIRLTRFDEAAAGNSPESAVTQQELHSIREKLVFPRVDGNPILALPSVKDAEPYKPGIKKKRRAPSGHEGKAKTRNRTRRPPKAKNADQAER